MTFRHQQSPPPLGPATTLTHLHLAACVEPKENKRIQALEDPGRIRNFASLTPLGNTMMNRRPTEKLKISRSRDDNAEGATRPLPGGDGRW